MISSLRRPLLAAGASILAILLLGVLWRYIVKHPPCCDAQGYLVMANAYLGWDAPAALFEELKTIRTYGYPAFLVPLLLVAKWTGANPVRVIFVVQIALYWLAVWWLAREYRHLHGERDGRLAFYALLANALVYPLVAIPLTDGLSVCLLFVLLAVGLRMLRAQAGAGAATGWHLLVALPLGLLTGFALMVRPSNLSFVGIPVLALVFMAVISARTKARASATVPALLLAGAGFLLVIAPQLAINVTHYGKWSILPTVNLGATVLEWGKHVLKYLTNMSGTEVQQCYRAPWPVPADQGVGWYFRHPLVGFKTAVLHVFGALDYDYYFTYVYDLKQPYRPLLFLYVHTCLFFGAVGLAARTVEARFSRWSGAGYLVTASAAYLLLWAAIQAVSHAEVRYSIGVFSLLLLFVPRGWVGVARHRVRLLPVFAAYLAVAWLLSHFLAALMAGCSGK